jgi:hypothetical protein
VSLGIVSVEVVASRKGTVAPRNPANMGLFLGMALHMPLQVLLSLEAPIATRLFAFELNLFDDWRQIFQHQVLLGGLPAEGLS